MGFIREKQLKATIERQKRTIAKMEKEAMNRGYFYKVSIQPRAGQPAMELNFSHRPTKADVVKVITDFEKRLTLDYSAYKQPIEKFGIPEEVGSGEPPLQVVRGHQEFKPSGGVTVEMVPLYTMSAVKV